MATRVGFIGLGAMGKPMCRNLLKAGFDLTVWNRSQSAIDELAAAGAKAGASAAEVARQADVIVTCVPNSPQVVEVVTGPNGVLAGAAAGSTVIDMSTIDPNVSQQVAAACAASGVRFLDAPVSGGTVGAVNGTLTIMVGGDAAVLEEARPVLAAMGTNIFHVGAVGMGEVVKLCNNLIYAAQMVAVAEAFTMGAKAGADPQMMFEVITRSTGKCVALDTRTPVAGVVPNSPASNEWQPGFMTALMLKDIGLALDFGKAMSVPMFVTAVAEQVHRLAVNEGHSRKDFSALALTVQRLAETHG
ncbi:MAG: 3-hydroxyisobutyrate dehydrogenase [Chloroflexi bacterium]|nr:3-hydroxyisobutyrate dehydrogenase [Chloroflexota bacterium]